MTRYNTQSECLESFDDLETILDNVLFGDSDADSVLTSDYLLNLDIE